MNELDDLVTIPIHCQGIHKHRTSQAPLSNHSWSKLAGVGHFKLGSNFCRVRLLYRYLVIDKEIRAKRALGKQKYLERGSVTQ